MAFSDEQTDGEGVRRQNKVLTGESLNGTNLNSDYT